MFVRHERCRNSVNIGSDEITLHLIARRADSGDLHRRTGTAGNEIARAGAGTSWSCAGRAPYHVIRCAGDYDPSPKVADEHRPWGSRPDVVARYNISGRSGAGDLHPVPVAGDDIAFRGRGSPDEVV